VVNTHVIPGSHDVAAVGKGASRLCAGAGAAMAIEMRASMSASHGIVMLIDWVGGVKFAQDETLNVWVAEDGRITRAWC